MKEELLETLYKGTHSCCCPSKRHCRNTDNETAKHSRIGIGARLQNVKVAIFQLFAHASRGYILNVTVCQIQV